MPTFNLKHFCRVDGLCSIHPENLVRLLHPHRDYLIRRGLTFPAPTAADGLDLKKLLDILISPDSDTPQCLTEALYYIHEMSTPTGMDLLLRDVDVQGCRATWLGDYHPADIAVKAWLDDPDLLQRRHAELHMRDFRAFKYFRTLRLPLPKFRAPSAAALQSMENRLSDAFAMKNRSRAARVFSYPQGDGTMWFLVRHGDPYRREAALNGGKPASVCYRPVRFDVAIYDPVAGELRVHATAPWEIILYRLEFGLCLFGDMRFFSDAPKYTLEPLREKGPDSLWCGEVRGIKYVTLREVHLLWGGRHKEVQIHRARDVFDALKARNSQMPDQPALVEASFDVRFSDSPHPRRVTVKPPNTALFFREEDAHLVDQWLLLHGFAKGREDVRHDKAGPPFLESA